MKQIPLITFVLFNSCDVSKKDLEDSQEGGSNKGPDIIPLSMDPDGEFS